jgi:hypothetical protein
MIVIFDAWGTSGTDDFEAGIQSDQRGQQRRPPAATAPTKE